MRQHPRGDEGAVLVLVLAFLAVFGVVVSALLTQSDISLRTSSAVTELGKKTYSADGALEVGIEAVQTDSTLCPAASPTPTVITTDLVVDPASPPVTVTCQTTDGGTEGGWRGYAVVTTSTAADSLKTQSGPAKTVGGPVFVTGGVQLLRDLVVEGGHLRQLGAPCASPDDARALPEPPYTLSCSSTLTAPVLDAVPPARPAATPPHDPAEDPVTGCTVFEPGTYTTAPALGDDNYFRSGVYYFDDVGEWTINGSNVVGGTAGGEMQYSDALPCFLEGTPDGAGVTFVLTGTSRLTVTNNAHVELHGRRPNTPDGTPGISVFVDGPRAAGPGVEQSTGNPQIVLHGSLYSPEADVLTNATGGVSAYLLNGVVASRFLLQSTGDGLRVSTEGGASTRRVLITATAPGAAGEREVVARALYDVADDVPNTLQLVARSSE